MAHRHTVSIAFLPDIMQHDAQHESTTQHGYANIIDPVLSKLLHEVDIVIGNIETTICNTLPKSGFPEFNAHSGFINAIAAQTGMTIAVLANNHMNDHGVKGVAETIMNCMNAGLQQVGAIGIDTVSVTVDDVPRSRVIIHAFSDISNKPDSAEQMICMNFNDSYAIPKDAIGICIAHTGEEYSKTLTERQKYIMERTKSLGYTACIMTHSHVIGDTLVLQNNASFFATNGLGNTISMQEKLDRQLGFIPVLTVNTLTKKIVSVDLHQVETVMTATGEQKVVLLNK